MLKNHNLKLFKKLISIKLIFVLLINTMSNTFAQVVPYMSGDVEVYNDLMSVIQKSVEAEEWKIKADLAKKFNDIDYGYTNAVFEGILNEIELQEKGKVGDYRLEVESVAEEEGKETDILSRAYNTEICFEIGKYYKEEKEEEICETYANIVGGLISGWLNYWETEPFIVMTEAKVLGEYISLGLVSDRDKERIRGAIWGEVKGIVEEIGGNSSNYAHGLDYYINKCKVKEGDYKLQEGCEKGLDVAELLVISSKGEKGIEAEVAQYIYEEVLKDSIKGGAYSSLLLMSGVSLLSAIDSAKSYELLERFLTKDSVPSLARQSLDDYEMMLSLKGVYQFTKDIGSLVKEGRKGQKYLNTYNKRWQYIDEDFSKRLGVRNYVLKNDRLMFDNRTYLEREYYNIAYGNLLTDIGKYIVQSGERGRALSKKIVEKYKSGERVHKPLVLGIVAGGKKGENIAVANLLGNSFYIDINGGTGKYILNSVNQAKGVVRDWQNVYGLDYYKFELGISDVNFLLDIFIDGAMWGLMAISIPSLIKRLYKLGKLVKYTKFNKLIKIKRVSQAGKKVSSPKGEVKRTPSAKKVTAKQSKKAVGSEAESRVSTTEKTSRRTEQTLNKVRTTSKNKANNIFKKPYSQMNKVERGIYDTYIKLELGGLGDLKSAIRDSKSLFTTKTGLKSTATSGLAFGVGEAPMVEARVMSAPTEVVSAVKEGEIFNTSITMFDRTGVNAQIGSSGRGVSKIPNNFKLPKVTPVKLSLSNSLGLGGMFSAFKILPTDPGLVKQQKQLNIERVAGIAAVSTGIAISLGLINPVVGITGLGTTLLASIPMFGIPGDKPFWKNDFNFNNLKYKIFPPKTNAQKLNYLENNIPEFKYTSVISDNGQIVSIEDNYGFVSQSEYEKFYDDNFSKEDAPKRLARKIAHDNLLADLIFKIMKSPTQFQLRWIMASAADDKYKLFASQLLKESDYPKITKTEIANYFVDIFNLQKISLAKLTDEDIERLRNATKRAIEETESLLDVTSPDDLILSGAMVDFDILKDDMSERAEDALYNASDLLNDIIEPLIQTKRNDYSTTYTNILPVYLYSNNGDLSKTPRIFIALSSPITVPDGFVVALDPSMTYKFIVRDIMAINKSHSLSRDKFKNPKQMYKLSEKDRQLLIESSLNIEDKNYIAASILKTQETPEYTDDLFAIVKALDKDYLDVALKVVALVAGADLAASLSSQLKNLIPIYGLVLMVAGFGYVSPLIASALKKYINKWGNAKTAEYGLLAMLATSVLGITAGMYGFYNPSTASVYSIIASALFFIVAATVASVFNTIKVPMLKSIYTDDSIFSSKNMGFDTTKALAKVFASGIPATFVLPQLISGKEATSVVNWSIMVPVILALSIVGLLALRHSRLQNEINAMPKENKASQTLSKKETEQEFKNTIKPLLKDEFTRLFMIYLPYGMVQSIIISQIAGIEMGKQALFITLTGSFISWGVRKIADKLLKSGKITEDQLTGTMLPLMALSYAGLFLSPFDLSFTSSSMPLLLSILGAYISTPTLCTVESTRMINKTVNYYNTERLKVEEDTQLSPEEKEKRINELNEKLKIMKTNTATYYNKGNASALYPIILLSLAAIGLLGTDGVNDFSQEYLPKIAEHLGGINHPADDVEGTIKLSFFKIFLSLAAGLSAATFLKNAKLTKSLFVSNKVKISQEKIDNGTITEKDLAINLNNMQNNINAIYEDIKKLNTDLTVNKMPLLPEELLNKWLQRAISINNRIKFLMTTDKDVASKLERAKESFKNDIVPNFQKVIKNSANDNYLLSDLPVSYYSSLFMSQYNSLLQSTQTEDLNYVEEGIKAPITTLHFVNASLYRDALIMLLNNKQQNLLYEGISQDFNELYNNALTEIELYQKDNKFNEDADPRINTLKKQLILIKNAFFGVENKK